MTRVCVVGSVNMDVVFTVGQYNMVSMALNTLGVQLDDGVGGYPT